ncbi:LptF/LptG family permease [Phycisphaera mikurensis]|uniref:LptF/LptG family permease n=1 Tax=Phycisphaera mikurensis (strain NBRC 102666 / KCTC 22515 / FYK2301M01) TaxID=1142394 RepID=I0IEP9_PHYMF|nr:LptF/LptG family permease [Phycisphaera mikurensis]MBB6441534.1 lipopolysaccharide export LptBFGC system permease protein LptF [Phycisphaera mikurensis]BAM03737.1 hypothetical protein PSMK_15780 [Phycisphaera mikurensis NBRC 102666]
MTITLARYILREVLKVGTLTCAVLVGVISFAAAIRPLSDGLLPPSALLRFVGFTAPTVLGFALPFAGAFASTIVFSRMAQDNEVLACSAGGISYRRLLAPVLALGLLLAGVLYTLSTTVVPSFYRSAEAVVRSDVVSILAAKLNQREPYEIRPEGGRSMYALFADSATLFKPEEVDGLAAVPGGDRVRQVVQLRGVALGELDRKTRVPGPASTAARATVYVSDVQGRSDSALSGVLRGVVRFDPSTQDYLRVERVPLGPYLVPSPLSDDIKFFSGAELRRLRSEPERYDEVAKAMDRLSSALATERLRLVISASGSTVTLNGPIGDERFVLEAAGIVPDGSGLRALGVGGGPVVVRRFAEAAGGGRRAERVFQADEARLSIDSSRGRVLPTIRLDLVGVTVQPGDTRQAELALPDLVWPEPIFETERQELSFEGLLELSTSPTYADSEGVLAARRKLSGELFRLDRRISFQSHRRAASAAACTLLLLLGALLSIQLRHQMPLVVFFWSFLLAITTIILINAGENVATGEAGGWGGVLGLAVTWTGVAVLVGVCLWSYRRVRRH